MEIWDAYNSDFEKIEGMTLSRDEPIPKDMYYLICNVLVQHMDGSYLLMQRDFKKHHGGMWQATAGGCALRGETPIQCAIRELREETGIYTEQLKEVGKVFDAEARSICVEFLCVTDWERDHITLQEGETMAFRWVSKDELVRMDKKELVTADRIQNFIEELQENKHGQRGE